MPKLYNNAFFFFQKKIIKTKVGLWPKQLCQAIETMKNVTLVNIMYD